MAEPGDAQAEAAEAHKKEGNAHFAKGDFLKAAAAYTKAIKAAPTNHVLYSNRAQVSACPGRHTARDAALPRRLASTSLRCCAAAAARAFGPRRCGHPANAPSVRLRPSCPRRCSHRCAPTAGPDRCFSMTTPFLSACVCAPLSVCPQL
jgi:hypothetical protein